MAYKTAFEKNLPKLVNGLPMNRLIPYLYPYGLMRDTRLAQDVVAAATDTEKARKFLEWMQPGVTILGVTDQFDRFIKAMDDFVKDTQDTTVAFLLKSIRQDLSHPPPEPTTQPATPQPAPQTEFDPVAAKKKIFSQYDHFVALRIDPMLSALFANRVITFTEKKRIDHAQKQSMEGMEWFLDNVIIPSLEEGISEKFMGLIEVMEEHDDPLLNRMAKILGYHSGTRDEPQPREVFNQRTINAYSEVLKKGSRSSNQFKLVTLGAEGAGKTSTINTLMGEKFQPNQETTVGASFKVARSIATSQWQKITATARVAELPRQRRGELKAQIALISLDPTPQSASVKPEVHQKAVKELKEIMATQDIKKDETRIIVFDIGGQEVYYEIHFLFLAVEDVALLVFKASIGLHTPVDPRAHSQNNQEKIKSRKMKTNLQTIEVLLQSVYSRGKKAPEGSISPRVPVVLMVGAHAEDVSIKEQEKMIQEIRDHFFSTPLLEHLPMSAEDCFYFIANSKPDQKVVNHLRSTILKAVQWVICIDRPISYLSFEEKILELKEVRIEKTRAVAIAKDAGIEGEHHIHALLDYYTKKGILLYFPELESLRNEVFLLPEEVSDLVCTVITTLDCYPHTGDLQQSYIRYQKYALLEGPLFNYMLSHYKRLKDKTTILGLLEKFSLAAKVPSSTKFPGETCLNLSESVDVYMIPSLLVYDQTNELRAKQSDDVAIVYYFGGKFLPETIFNKLVVRIMHWCCNNKIKKHHEIKCIKRGFGFFYFEKGYWQSFKLQLCQSKYSIKCFITVHHHDSEEPPSDLLQQRQDLLSFLTSSIKELSKPHMSESKLPVTYLECPYHEDDIPHIELDIENRQDLFCNFGSNVKRVDKMYYEPLYESALTLAPHQTSISDCKSVIEKLTEHYDKLTRLPINSMLDSLITSEVITFDEKKNIETKSLESDRMRHLLDNVIILGLQVELPELYHKFVKVLQESESMINRAMAKMIGPSNN